MFLAFICLRLPTKLPKTIKIVILRLPEWRLTEFTYLNPQFKEYYGSVMHRNTDFVLNGAPRPSTFKNQIIRVLTVVDNLLTAITFLCISQFFRFRKSVHSFVGIVYDIAHTVLLLL